VDRGAPHPSYFSRGEGVVFRFFCIPILDWFYEDTYGDCCVRTKYFQFTRSLSSHNSSFCCCAAAGHGIEFTHTSVILESIKPSAPEFFPSLNR